MEFLMLWEVICRRKWIIITVFFLFFSTVVIGTHFITPTYEATAKVLVNKINTIASIMSDLGVRDIGSNIDADTDNFTTNIALAQIRPLLEELISSLSLKDKDGEVLKPEKLVDPGFVNKLFPQPSLKIEQYEDSRVLEIVSTSSDSAEAADVSNMFANLYIENILKRTKEDYKSVRLFMEDQVQIVKEEYYNSLADLQRFRIQEKVIDLDLETQNLIDKIDNLQNNYEENERKLVKLEEEIANVKEQLSQKSEFRTETKEFVQNELANELKSKINELMINISGKTVDIYKEHPDFKRLEEELETAKDIVKKEAEIILNKKTFKVDPTYEQLSNKLVNDYIEREIAITQRKLLERYINEYQRKLLEMPVKQDENVKLQSLITMNRELYQTLQEYLYQLRIGEAVTISNVRLIETAVEPEKPEFPRKPLMYILGIFLGGFWGFAVALLAEYIDNTVKTPEDLKKISSLSLLGSIPKTRLLKRSRLISHLPPSSPIIEVYRTIRNNIRYTSGDKLLKTIIITSFKENEGKSSVASNLSLTFNMEGKKVVVVDLNMRKPALHKFFHVPNEKGLTNVLSKNVRLVKADIRTHIEGLDVIHCGPVPLNPSRLIDSQRLKNLIRILKEKYDIVIIDTPPLIVVNDAFVIGVLADGMIFVIEPGKTPLSVIEHAKDTLTRVNIKLIGVVLNKFNASRTSYHPYYYLGH